MGPTGDIFLVGNQTRFDESSLIIIWMVVIGGLGWVYCFIDQV